MQLKELIEAFFRVVDVDLIPCSCSPCCPMWCASDFEGVYWSSNKSCERIAVSCIYAHDPSSYSCSLPVVIGPSKAVGLRCPLACCAWHKLVVLRWLMSDRRVKGFFAWCHRD